jgi:predicted enzyme related to lactoylglutathione lyase
VFSSNDAYASFSVDDIDAARAFYGTTLGFEVREDEMGFLELRPASGGRVLIYAKRDHQPATFTVLNIVVADIDRAVDGLVGAGIEMQRYEGFNQDSKGISREYGGTIAWFSDPAGNVLAVLENA